MRLRVFLAAQVLAVAMAGPAFADWQAVGVVDVGHGAGRDRVEANFDKPARQLRFTAEAGDVSCRSIKLEFRSGKKQKAVLLRLKAGAGDVVNVAGAGRILKRVVLDCATGQGAAARIGVAVLFAGDQAGAAAAAPGVVTAPNIVIQNSQANDNKAPGDLKVVTQPSTNVVIQGSQVNQPPAGEAGVVTLPQRNVVIERSQVNQGQGSAPGVVMTPPASTNVVIAPAQSGTVATPPACPPAQTAIGAMRQAGGAIQPGTQTGTAGSTAPVCQ